MKLTSLQILKVASLINGMDEHQLKTTRTFINGLLEDIE